MLLIVTALFVLLPVGLSVPKTPIPKHRRPADSVEFDNDPIEQSIQVSEPIDIADPFGDLNGGFGSLEDVFPNTRIGFGSQIPDTSFPDFASAADLMKEFEKKIEAFRKTLENRLSGGSDLGNPVEPGTVINYQKSVTCKNGRCRICKNGDCFNGTYSSIMFGRGECADAVCVDGCSGFVLDIDPNDNRCPICKCPDAGLIAPCASDSDCAMTSCNLEYNACSYPPPSGELLRQCIVSLDCEQGERCGADGYCVEE